MPDQPCSSCQTENVADSNFCRNCGKDLNAAAIGFLIPSVVPGLEQEIEIRRLPFVVGRARQCDLFLNLSSVSRQHATFEYHDGRLFLTDNGSVNGTHINGIRISSSPLADGDRIRIGSTEFDFRDAARPAPPAAPRPEERSLSMLLEISKAINSSLILDDVLQLVMNSVMQVTGSDRGYLLIKEASGELKFSVLHTGDAPRPAEGPPKISMSTVNKVFETGVAMVSIDVDSDTNIRSQLSVVSLGLRSIMCVPLKTKNGTLGIIYVDSNRRSKNFNEADLRVLEALADHAAIAIENAQLQKSLLEKQRIEQELEFAAIIQRSFLPLMPPESERFLLSAQSLSAKTVGGDFYDFISIGGQRLGIAIGDVSGKGIPAALYMARLISDLRFIASSEPSPAATLERINEQLVRRSRRGMFVTMIYILLDTDSGEATCANAGHLPVLLQGQRGVESLNRNTGVPLGILPDTRYEEFTFRMEPGDHALLYTDGIIEAINLQQQRYTLQRVIEYMERNSGGRPLAESLFDEVQEFAGEAPQHDDMTLLSIHRRS